MEDPVAGVTRGSTVCPRTTPAVRAHTGLPSRAAGSATVPPQNAALGRRLLLPHNVRKLHSLEKGTLEKRTPRSAVTRRLSLGLMPMPRAAS